MRNMQNILNLLIGNKLDRADRHISIRTCLWRKVHYDQYDDDDDDDDNDDGDDDDGWSYKFPPIQPCCHFLGKSKKFKILRSRNLLPTQLCRAATTKPGQIECSSFFLLDHNNKTRIYRLVSGSFDVPLQRKCDSPKQEDDCAPPSH